MSDEAKAASLDELWNMVKILSQHVDNLNKRLEAEQVKNEELNTENSGWLDVYQRLLSQNLRFESEAKSLRSVISDLESRLREYQGGS
jgi:hypothetical protein